MRKRVRVWVSGRVQGVYYRGSTCREADRLGLMGWVRNLADGRVELVAEGEESAIQALLNWCAEGPPMARVDEINVLEEPIKGVLIGFQQIRGA
ncbi:acylphosphatase [Methylococcus sp. EFPC2]|uniref:acylphosphatase n=1 Tax=Methylococcus sp. EFPC2 TaxID=2812648 RepID=UPI001967AA06|nr:acylphosphatase [Methylococcus sp. EFPC2]QSA97960.1 acylphosphatase [Methylococcus sp. EFPC2]